ncbi:glutamine-hydrolyzing GMP synthase [SAR202 cluster bacterium AC-647-N09_OGT_505m]|nr:glutamine-hydrolyzing GMP synthase [SAR202 cluster bacterium AC-647-N09_OGT_505m]
MASQSKDPTTNRIAAGDDVETFGGKGEVVLVIDFGAQYSHLIARRVRECRVYCEIVLPDTTWEQVAHLNPRGIILSGGPASVYEPNAPMAPSWVYERQLPVLGICYGLQLLAHQLGGKVVPGNKREYGHAVLHQNAEKSPLFADLPSSMTVWMSHGDHVEELPPSFRSLAYTDNSPIAVLGNDKGILGLQFHPEVIHTPEGKKMIENFLYRFCQCQGTWTPSNFAEESIARIKEQVGNGKVICALSGGVDSTVAAALIHRAIGDQLTCIFVNNGLLRQQEADHVVETFERNLKMNLVYVDATEDFLTRLATVIDPEEKRRAIGVEFIRIFEQQAAQLGQVDFLAQGTLYPDVIESKSSAGSSSATIKTHHNVGGLPENMTLSLVEPLRYLFKDEVREMGLSLGLSEEMVYRQPFPGPGLAIRIIGEITWDKLEVLRACDRIVMDEIQAAGLYNELWQSFAVLTDTRTVGVMGDFRTYGYMVAIRAVTSEDAMTADWARLPYDVLAKMSNRIVNEVAEVNRVVYDITSKPPGTIEWE